MKRWSPSPKTVSNIVQFHTTPTQSHAHAQYVCYWQRKCRTRQSYKGPPDIAATHYLSFILHFTLRLFITPKILGCTMGHVTRRWHVTSPCSPLPFSKGKTLGKRLRNIIRHFIFVSFLYFFYHSSCRKDQFTVLIFELKILLICWSRSTKDPAYSHWFVVMVLPSQAFLRNDVYRRLWQKSHGDHEITIMTGSKMELFLGDRPWFWAKEDEWPLLLGRLSSLRVLRKNTGILYLFRRFWSEEAKKSFLTTS